MDGSVGGLFAAGGVVLWLLMGFSWLSLALIFERLLFWFRVLPRQEKLVQYVFALYRSNTPRGIVREEVVKALRKNAQLPMARIFLAAMELRRPTPEKLRLALETAAQAELPVLYRFSTVFDTIISVSPLLGLLGTILGLIQSFAALRIGEVGGGDTPAVVGGISEALITTAAGLIVAVFTLLFANLFRGMYQRQRSLIQQYGGQLELLCMEESEQ